MTFIRSVLVLLAAIALLLVPYSLGHALSNHHTTPVIFGIVALVVLSGLALFLTRRRQHADSAQH
ncbi:MAG TPA: LPXTG cell wall anchor domain-containing protein [Longimicrobiales bacterium]|nr:LPXTG cell wall anchor domain-containing protein [Longimicrobiales bacterium]